MVNYTKAIVDGLVEEWQAQKLGVSEEYMEILNLQDSMAKAKNNIHKVRNWQEPKRFYGLLSIF